MKNLFEEVVLAQENCHLFNLICVKTEATRRIYKRDFKVLELFLSDKNFLRTYSPRYFTFIWHAPNASNYCSA